jgi:hypothetical protein
MASDPPTIREVVRQLVEGSRELNRLDDDIGALLRETEALFREKRPTGYPVDVPFPPWGRLGWSGRRNRWRLVVIDEDECEDLLSMPRDCRADACALLRKLAERMGVLEP